MKRTGLPADIPRKAPDVLSPPITAILSRTPQQDASSPRIKASAITDRYSWPLRAPTVRNIARVRRRCATRTWNVLAITSAATNMASTPNTRRNVVMIFDDTELLFSDSFSAWARDFMLTYLGRSLLIFSTVSCSLSGLILRKTPLNCCSSRLVFPSICMTVLAESSAQPPI